MNAATSEAAEAHAAQVRANKLDLLERLADDLAHEIKNPLHSLVINLEVLKRRIGRVGESQADDMLRYVGVLDGELARVNRRIELLLRLVRPGRSADDVPVGEVLDDLLELLELECARRKVTFHFEVEPSIARARLPGDAGRQIVLNLVLIVLDRVPAGGTLTVRGGADDGRALLLACGAPLTGPAVPDTADERIVVARALCERIGARLLDGDADETPADCLGISMPVARR